MRSPCPRTRRSSPSSPATASTSSSTANGGATPTPVISHAILTHDGVADGIVVTPSHNPPGDGGFKYNPPHGGPADTDVTGWIERRGQPAARARAGSATCRAPTPRVTRRDYVTAYVDDLGAVIDLDAIRGAGLKLGVDPLGGASLEYWKAIRDRLGLDLEIVNDAARPDVPLRPARPRRQDPHGLLVRRSRWRGCATSPTASTSPSPTTRTPTATGSSRRATACSTRTTTSRRASPTCSAATATGATTSGSARRSSPRRSSTRRGRPRPAPGRGPRGLQVVRRPACSTARSASAGRRARAPRSCAATARAWSTDKDGLIPCLLAAEMKATTGEGPGRALRRARAPPRPQRLHAHGRRRHAGAEGRPQAALARAGRPATSSPGSRSRPSSPRRPATARRSAGSR